ncbi:retrovirus-related pol polyprotein from transposon TNT 1-94 [Tanacetum coccineum]
MHRRSSTKEIITPFKNPKRVFRSKRRLFETPGLVDSSSPKLDLFSDIEEHSKEETTKIMTETMEQYMIKTRGNYGSGVVRPKINDKTHFELEGQFLKELHKNTFSGSKHEDQMDTLKKSLRSLTYFLFPRQILDSKGAIPTKTAADAKIAIQEMAEYSQKWHNGTSSKARRPHYIKDYPLKEEGKTLEEAYYTQFGAPYQPGGQYKAAGLGLYQRNNEIYSYTDRRQTLEESLTNTSLSPAKDTKENSNIIKEIRASIDAAIRNQGASIKTLEIQIGQMSKVLQERAIGGPYAVSDARYNSLTSETVSFPRRLHVVVDPGASVSVMPLSTYSNLGLGNLAHTRLTIELANITIKHPRGIAENVLVRIDVFKRKITLRVGEEKLVFKSVKPATSIIRRVYIVNERTDIDSKIEFLGEAINESFDPLYGNYIELNDLDMPLEP